MILEVAAMNATRREQKMTNPILRVRNIEQAALWLELDGQISDGKWEGARPHDHWQVWCKAEVVVANDDNLGRNFWAVKDNYNFSDRELLKIVGLRMLGMVRIARAYGISVAKALEFCVDTDGQLEDTKRVNDLMGPSGKYSRGAVMAALADTSYTLRDMIRDLNDLKTIVRKEAR
jgi:hypothetical protein